MYSNRAGPHRGAADFAEPLFFCEKQCSHFPERAERAREKAPFSPNRSCDLVKKLFNLKKANRYYLAAQLGYLLAFFRLKSYNTRGYPVYWRFLAKSP